MKLNYMKRAALALGAVAILGTTAGFAQEKGAWRNINHKLHNVSRCDGWSGVLTGSAFNIGEVYTGACLVYQVIPDAPAGTYTLTAHAFNRSSDAPLAFAARQNGEEGSNANLFINGSEAPIKSLFDLEGITDADLLDGDNNYKWGVVPNSLEEARALFDQGKYFNTITVEHPGGDLVFGVRNYGNPNILHVENREWTAFGDFKLVGPNGEVEIANPNFEFSGDDWWDTKNIAGADKGRGNHNGALFSKTNASPYNFGQTLENMPAGKYRFVVTGFNNHFLGEENGFFVPMKGAWEWVEGKSGKDYYEEGATSYPMGQYKGGEEWVPSGWANVEVLEAYVYINEGIKEIGFLNENNINVWEELVNGKQTRIMNIFDEKLDQYPHSNNYMTADGTFRYLNEDGTPMWWESGMEYEAVAFFIAHPDMYQNVVEMEFTGESNTFTVGTRKDFNQNNFWQPTFDWRLEYWDPEYVAVESVNGDMDMNAPEEYYNIQGIRVAEPSNGIFIVKKGNKVSKRVIR